MDPGARENFLGALSDFGRQENVPSLIYVTHHIEEILPWFKKTLVLKEGKVVRAGETRAVLKNNVLEDLYGVRLEMIKRKGRFWPVLGLPGVIQSPRKFHHEAREGHAERNSRKERKERKG
jgi:iron complex transport system ATP-binding protein